MFKCCFSERRFSKRMKLVKRVRENYIRDDIPCGFECCKFGVYNKFPVFAIVSSEIIKKHLALLKSDFIRPIVCHSVLNKLSHSEQRKIKKIIDTKKYFIFYDDFSSFTCGKDLYGVLEYYKEHTNNKNIILLDDTNIDSYKNYFDGNKEVEDLISKVNEVEETNYEEYYKTPEAFLNDGKIIRGKLMTDAYSWFNGSIFDNNKLVRILGKVNMNRAIHGDEVYVELINEVYEDLLGDNEEITSKKICNKENNDVLYGKVVGICKRIKTELIGTIINGTVSGDGTQNVLVLPIDKKYPPVRIRTSQIDELVNKRLMIELEDWDVSSKYPIGHYYKKLSNIGDREGEIECILLSNGVNYYKDKWIDLFKCVKSNNFYDEQTLKKLEGEKSTFFSLEPINEQVEKGYRKDLRHLNVMSIDPQGCTDVDDTLHALKLPNGNLQFGVHIADVTQYVKQESLLDKIAQDRCTTVYLPDRRIDMLPEFLSAGLCSLLEKQERAAFSVVWEVDKEMNVVSTEFYKSLIKSRKAFSYEEAYNVLENEPSHEFYEELVTLKRASEILRNKRLANGALDLSTAKFERVKDNLTIKEELYTHSLVEEFMLLANIAVGEFIYKNLPEKSLLRKHPPPSSRDLSISIDISSTTNINSVAKDLPMEKREVYKKIVTKTMNQAYYIRSDESSDYHHYGLSVPIYTHFTSPIRRYADIIVHRLLQEVLDKKIDLPVPCGKRHKQSDNEIYSVSKELIDNINYRHNSAKRCSWNSTVLFTYHTIREMEPETMAYVTEIKSNGVCVYIPEFSLDTYIMVEGEVTYNVFDTLRIKINRDDECFYVNRRFNITILSK